MQITDILEPSCIIAPLESTCKEDAITQLIDVLANNNLLKDRDVVFDSVMQREKTRSTGIGNGLAIPHGKSSGITKLAISIGVLKDEIEFNAIDAKPVKIIVLLASPSSQTGPHIQALAAISTLMIDNEFKTMLENAKSPEEAFELIKKKEAK